MTDTSVIISYIDVSNNAKQRSIKNINPEVNTEKLVDWAKAIIHITDNTYVGTSIIHKIILD